MTARETILSGERARSALMAVALATFAAVLIALSARAEIHLWFTPVPITLQVLVVLLIGLSLTPRQSFLALGRIHCRRNCGLAGLLRRRFRDRLVAWADRRIHLGLSLCRPARRNSRALAGAALVYRGSTGRHRRHLRPWLVPLVAVVLLGKGRAKPLDARLPQWCRTVCPDRHRQGNRRRYSGVRRYALGSELTRRKEVIDGSS